VLARIQPFFDADCLKVGFPKLLKKFFIFAPLKRTKYEFITDK